MTVNEFMFFFTRDEMQDLIKKLESCPDFEKALKAAWLNALERAPITITEDLQQNNEMMEIAKRANLNYPSQLEKLAHWKKIYNNHLNELIGRESDVWTKQKLEGFLARINALQVS